MDPLNPSLRPDPKPAAPRAPRAPDAQPDAVDLSRRLEEGGGELGLRRRFRLPFVMDPVKRLEPEEAVRILQEGGKKAERLRVTPAGTGTPLPIHTVADLQEAVAFQEGQPPADAGALPRLAAQGWRFHATVGGAQAEVGLYGAYNALTDPDLGIEGLEAVRDGVRVSVADAAVAASLADFTDDPAKGGALGPTLQALEEQGYRFFDAAGHEHGAFEAARAPGYMVGREGEAWFPLRHLDATRADRQLATFAAFRELGEGLEFWDEFRVASEPALQPDRLAALAGRAPHQPERAKAVLEGLAHHAGDPGVAKLAASVAHDAPEPKILETLVGRLADKDRMAFAVAVFQATPGAGEALLKGLADDPTAARIQEAVQAQQSRVSQQATITAYFANPKADPVDMARRVMTAVTSTRSGGQLRADAALVGARLVEGLRTPAAEFAKALAGPADEYSRYAILQAFLVDPGQTDPAAFARMAADLKLYSSESAKVGRVALERLAAHPPFAETAGRALAAADLAQHDESRAAVFGIALRNLRDPANFALRAMDAMTAGNQGHRYRVDAARVGLAALEGLRPAPAAELALALAGEDELARFVVARAFLAHADAKTPEDLLVPVREAVAGLYAAEGSRIALAAIDRLAGHPPFAATFARARQAAGLFGRAEPRCAVLRMVLEDPQGKHLSTPDAFALCAMELATAGPNGHQHRAEAALVGMEALKELKADFALELAGAEPYTQFQVSRAFLAHAGASAPEDLLVPVREAVANLYATEGNRVALAALARLESHPPFAQTVGRARKAAALVQKDEPRFNLLRRILQDPEGQALGTVEAFALAAMDTITSGNYGHQYREDAARVGMAALQELQAQPAPALALALAGEEVYTRYQVSRTFLAHAGATTPEDLVGTVQEVVDTLYALEGSRLALATLERFEAHPPFAANFARAREAAALVRKAEARLPLLRLALQNPPGLTDEAFALKAMAAVTSGNNGHQYREDAARVGMAALEAARAKPSAALALELAGTEAYSQHQVALNFLAHPTATTPEELLVPLRDTVDKLYHAEGARLAGAFLERFASHPPFAATAARALKASALIEKDEPRARVLRGVLQDPTGKAVPDDATFALGAMAAVTAGNYGHQFRGDAARLGMAALESLKAKPAAELALALAGQEPYVQMVTAQTFLAKVDAAAPDELLALARQVVDQVSAAGGARVARTALERLAAHPPFAPVVAWALPAVDRLKSDEARKAVLAWVMETLEAKTPPDPLEFGVGLVNAVTSLHHSHQYSEDAAELARWALEGLLLDPALAPAASFALDVTAAVGPWHRLRVCSIALATARHAGREAMFSRAVSALQQCGTSAGPLLAPTVGWLAARPELSLYRPGLEALAGKLTAETKPQAVIDELLRLQKLARDTEGFVDRALGKGDRGPAIQEDGDFVQIGPVRLPKAAP